MKILPLLTALLCAFTLSAQDEFGVVSYYADAFHGRTTANGEKYNKNKLSAAHRTLPFGTIVKVTRLDNKKSIELRINDRGPFIKGRIVDVSRKAAEVLDLINDGTAKVKLEVIKKNGKKTKVKKDVLTIKSTKEPNKATKKSENKTEMPTKIPTPTKKEVVTAKDFQTYDLYKIEVVRPEKKGYGIQVASLTQYENVLRQVAQLQDQWFDNIMISIEKKEEKPVYKIILGPFNDMPTAQSYKRSLIKKGLEAFVIKLNDIQY